MQYFTYTQQQLTDKKELLAKISENNRSVKFACEVLNKSNTEGVLIDVQFVNGMTNVVYKDYTSITIDEFNKLMTEDFTLPSKSTIYGRISSNHTEDDLHIDFVIYLLLDVDSPTDLYIERPVITNLHDGDVVKMSDITVESSKFLGNDPHSKTEYIISKYQSGVDPIIDEIVDVTIKHTLKSDTSKLNSNEYYYLFVRYIGSNGTKSEYSYPIKILLVRDYTVKFVFDTTLYSSNNNKITLGLRLDSGIPSPITVDWGDKTSTTYKTGHKFTVSDPGIHLYKSAGTYTVTVNCFALPIQKDDAYFKKTLTKILSPLPPIIEDLIDEDCVFSEHFTYDNFPNLNELPEYFFQNNYQLTSINNCFENDVLLTSIPNKLTYRLSNLVTAENLFLGCKNLTIPADLFAYSPNLTSVNAAFKDTTITSIPGTLLRNNLKLESAVSLFENSGLTKIPGDLFLLLSNLKNISKCFKNTPVTSIPKELFSEAIQLERIVETFSSCKKITKVEESTFKYNNNIFDFTRCFYNCTSLKEIPAELFNNITTGVDPTECFRGCTSLLNLPEYVFPKNIKTAYGVCNGCTSLRTISIYAFSKCSSATSFDYAFANTSSLNLVGNIFTDCVAAESFKYTFSNSGLRSVPETLFNSQGNVTTFDSCFYGCSELTEIPGNLFNANIRAKSFKQCFAKCGTGSSENININYLLFSNCTEASDFSFCFKEAKISEIPIELFKNNINATTFESCFENTGLTSIPDDLFTTNTEIENLNNCFKNCQSVTRISSRLLVNCIKLKTAANLLNNTNIATIPDQLFKNQINVIDLSGCFANTNIMYVTDQVFITCRNLEKVNDCFNNCQEIVGMDKYVFRTNTKLKTVKNLFKNAVKLNELPLGFFRYNSEITDFSYCFQNCIKCRFNNPFGTNEDPNRFSSITGKINFSYMFNNMADEISDEPVSVPEIWNYTYKQTPTSVGTFRKSKNLDYILNYNSIPDNWK